MYPPRLPMQFPTGMAMVEIIPETARLSLNQGRPDQFVRLLIALGATPERAQDITLAIVDWRSGSRQLDQYYLSLNPSFLPRHASFQDVEEALYLRGMTPELFHGSYTRDPQGRLIRQSGFKDCVSPWGTIGPFDVNHAEPPLLAAMGIPPDTVQQIVELRRQQPMVNLNALTGARIATTNLRVGGHTIYTFRSTARVYMPNVGPGGPLSEVARTVSAQVKFRKPDLGPPPYQIIRWWDQAESPLATPAEVSLWR
ncbi:MAG: type II secretion system protein GspK [Bryobacteraceae bacterium]